MFPGTTDGLHHHWASFPLPIHHWQNQMYLHQLTCFDWSRNFTANICILALLSFWQHPFAPPFPEITIVQYPHKPQPSDINSLLPLLAHTRKHLTSTSQWLVPNKPHASPLAERRHASSSLPRPPANLPPRPVA